jgi:hypothetical protein
LLASKPSAVFLILQQVAGQTPGLLLLSWRRRGSQEDQIMCVERGRCPDCDSGVVTGDGRCSHCHGSGTNLNLASDIPQCLFCKGTCVCQTCGGDGMIQLGGQSGESGIPKLFED